MARGVKREVSYTELEKIVKLEVDEAGNPTLYRKNISSNLKWKNKGAWLEVINKKNHSSGYSSVWTSSTFMAGKGYSLYYHIIVVSLHLRRTLSPTEYVDHIDGNRVNNNLHNLRVVTARENAQNKKTKQVGYCQSRGKYVSHIRIHNKLRRLGVFATREESQKRYWLAVSLLDYLKVMNSAKEMREFIEMLNSF